MAQIEKIGAISRGVIIGTKDHDVVFASVDHIRAVNWDQYQWFVIDDRKLYRPNEEVHIKGYLRYLKRVGDKISPEYAKANISYCVNDAQSVC